MFYPYHIPIILSRRHKVLQSFTGSLGQPLYLKEQGKKLDEIITSFNDVVAAVLVAHVHSNELRYNPKYQDDAPPMLVGSSLSPCYTTNPAFRVVKYDSGASESPLDMATFAVDLSDSIPADVTNPFTSLIPSLIDFLDMASLTNKETLKLAKSCCQDLQTTTKQFGTIISMLGIKECHKHNAMTVKGRKLA